MSLYAHNPLYRPEIRFKFRALQTNTYLGYFQRVAVGADSAIVDGSTVVRNPALSV